MRTVIIIPARLAAQRLPGKPLAPLGDVPLVVRVAMQARKAKGVDEVVVATDSVDVQRAVAAHGVRCEMTRGDHPSGSDRVAEAARVVGADCVVNLQGDEPFVVPQDLSDVANALHNCPCEMVTLKAPIDNDADMQNPNVVKVVCNDAGYALYFSRAPIPYDRQGDGVRGRGHRHIGVYGYHRDALERMCSEPPHPLEECEKLEQLRALAMGMRLLVLPARSQGHGIDTAEDLAWARQRVERFGEDAFP